MEKRVLLIADDDEMNRVIIRRFLKNTYEILEAPDGKRAMEIITSTHVDALLLDIIMPKMDGLEVLKQLKQDDTYENVGILVATSTKEKTERTALSLGADDIVSKPYDPIVIQKRMENILLIKEVQRNNRLLVQNETDELLREEMEKISQKVLVCTDKMKKLTRIMKNSEDNPKLLVELANEMNLEVDALNGIFGNDR